MNAAAAIDACLWGADGGSDLKVAERDAEAYSNEPYEVTLNRKGQVTVCIRIDTRVPHANLWPRFGSWELVQAIDNLGHDDWRPKRPPDPVTWLGKIAE